ncbi:hypothetical protein PV325_010884 [Microctonus aethiopoides]|nr:hypothetical protein PV325_010884 [Microctonus aethiopoides]
MKETVEQRSFIQGHKIFATCRVHQFANLDKNVEKTGSNDTNAPSEMKSDSSRTSPSQDLDWAIGWNRGFLQIMGLWTYPNHSLFIEILSNIQAAFLALLLFFFLQLPQSMALIKVWGEIGLMNDNLTLNLPNILSEFKFFILWYKKKDVASIFAMITQDWLEDKSSYERDVMIKHAKLSRMIIICGAISMTECVVVYHVPLAFNSVVRTINNITDKPGALFAIQSVYFYDVTPTHIYRMTVLSQVIAREYGKSSKKFSKRPENRCAKALSFNQCELLYHSVYNCNWTSLTSNESSQITLLLIRTKKPLCITFGKFAPLTLNTFIQVCKTSCGWVSVLLTMKN